MALMSTTANEVSVITTNDVETVVKETCDDQAVLKAHEDRYNGVVVDVENMQNDASLVKQKKLVYGLPIKVLVVQEKCGPYKDSGLWKMPTGRINQIDTEFVQVVGFRDGHNAPFGKSDMLFVCMLRSLSSNIVGQDTEVSAAKWMAIGEFASQPKNQQSKLLKDMIGACVGNVKGRCKGFSGTAISSNSREPSAFYCSALDAE